MPKPKNCGLYVEKLVTQAKKARQHEEKAEEFSTSAERDTSEWKSWRESDQWQKWNQAMAPAVDLRRRAFSKLRDNEAVDVLFDELATRFEDRPGGYTRVVRLATVRLGDSGQQALIEFVGDGDRDRKKVQRRALRWKPILMRLQRTRLLKPAKRKRLRPHRKLKKLPSQQMIHKNPLKANLKRNRIMLGVRCEIRDSQSERPFKIVLIGNLLGLKSVSLTRQNSQRRFTERYNCQSLP